MMTNENCLQQILVCFTYSETLKIHIKIIWETTEINMSVSDSECFQDSDVGW